ncbi:hypothetical protein CDAR_376161 [Caerostris darwini]|uniref:Uncharacterized protein n=1 Tax=Caerostris darwini TaxID=1538125 RepID=A0AAV4VES9_9ARAC|nr:hypothetical protein CDAR_376161 [Caerostris darwini]
MTIRNLISKGRRKLKLFSIVLGKFGIRPLFLEKFLVRHCSWERGLLVETLFWTRGLDYLEELLVEILVLEERKGKTKSYHPSGVCSRVSKDEYHKSLGYRVSCWFEEKYGDNPRVPLLIKKAI